PRSDVGAAVRVRQAGAGAGLRPSLLTDRAGEAGAARGARATRAHDRAGPCHSAPARPGLRRVARAARTHDAGARWRADPVAGAARLARRAGRAAPLATPEGVPAEAHPDLPRPGPGPARRG